MRFSRLYAPTTKEAPKDALLASHIYLSRAGFISQVASGLYNYLPLGKRVLKKIEAVINEEMANIYAQEVELSFVTPIEFWEESGRVNKFGKELLRFKDRKDNGFVLGPTHEEMMVNIVRGRVTSYKQLPLNLYQIKTKFRDEARPRFGLMRAREFVMKDGYSFHASYEDMDREFDLMEATYKRILERLGLEFRIVEADSGAIGGSGSKELMVLADSGEDTIAVCDTCEYGANVEAAVRAEPRCDAPAPALAYEKIHTPELKSINDLSTFFKADSYYIVKTVAKRLIFEEDSKIVLYFLRGSDELQEVKAVNAVNALEIADVSDEELRELGLVPGFMGPMGLENITLVFDASLKGAKSMICGANEKDFHYVGVDMETEQLEFSDLVQVQEGDGCARCAGKLSYTKGIEVGHIFKLGTTYSKPLGATFLDENGKSQEMVMGTYGMGVSRLIAAVIEQHNDEKGCIWTETTAPYRFNILISNIKDEEQLAYAEELYAELSARGVEVIIDDRKERFGFKMNDAELIGFPYTIIVGKNLAEGIVQIAPRSNSEKIEVKKDELLARLMELK
ncbi:MAG: proline--tRNA ligase [Campylobacterales bacterium]|nr:proline--tRNA ligase [Campylobacterales bacterium]